MARPASRGPRLLLLTFALSVLVPAVVLAFLAYRSVEKEKRALLAERRSGLQRAGLLIRSELGRLLAELRDDEDRRPWYQYNPVFFEPNYVGKGQVYVQSPIALVPPNRLIEGYFNTTPEGELESPNDAQSIARLDLQQNDRVSPPRPDEPSVPPGQRDPCDPQPPPQGAQAERNPPAGQGSQGGAEPEQQQVRQAEDQRFAEQAGRTQRALTNAGRNLQSEIAQVKETLPRELKGRFPDVAAQNRTQKLSRQAADANLNWKKNVQEMSGPQGESRKDAPEQEPTGDQLDVKQVVEVEVSPFVFRTDPDEGILAFRFVDVDNFTPEFGGRPFVRYVQGFSLDSELLFGQVFPELAARYLDVPGGEAALLAPAAAAPAGSVVFDEDLTLLPDHRVVVTDGDEGWVARRVSRLSLILLGVAGGLLLVILGGLAFTVRTVRTELGLARRKSDFVAAVTHELRTPLTGIKMYADMMQAGWVKDEETRGEYVGFMAQEADRLARLVNRVLDFARTDKGGRSLAPVDLEVPIREVERSFGPWLEERGFVLRVEVDDHRPVLADADALKQILLNLLENAAKYAAPAENRTVTVRVEERGRESLLTVSDHGPGVPDAERDRVFMDFYRPGEELTREASGAGIGLALVRRLAEGMGGSADLRTTPGGGATFRVRLRTAPA